MDFVITVSNDNISSIGTVDNFYIKLVKKNFIRSGNSTKTQNVYYTRFINTF